MKTNILKYCNKLVDSIEYHDDHGDVYKQIQNKKKTIGNTANNSPFSQIFFLFLCFLFFVLIEFHNFADFAQVGRQTGFEYGKSVIVVAIWRRVAIVLLEHVLQARVLLLMLRESRVLHRGGFREPECLFLFPVVEKADLRAHDFL